MLLAISGPTTNHDEIRRWAERHGAVPAEMMPSRVDGEPSTIRILLESTVNHRTDALLLPWDEFFMRFDLLGLSFVYDDASGQHELLQVEEKSPYRRPAAEQG